MFADVRHSELILCFYRRLSWALMYAGFVFVVSIFMTLVIKLFQMVILTGFVVVVSLFTLYGLSLVSWQNIHFSSYFKSQICKPVNGTPLQCSCQENPRDGGAWWAAVRGVARSRTRLSDFTFTFHFHALEKEMATHSSVLARRIPGMGEPGGLPSMGSHRVGDKICQVFLTLPGRSSRRSWVCLGKKICDSPGLPRWR